MHFKIGIVEDNLSFIDMLKDNIEVSMNPNDTYEIQTASNENQYETILEYLYDCDILFLDYHLDSGFTGTYFAEKILENRLKKNSTIVFLSNDKGLNINSESETLGITFIPKHIFSNENLYTIYEQSKNTPQG